MNILLNPSPILIGCAWYVETTPGLIVGPYESKDDAMATARQMIDDERRRETLENKGRAYK